MKHFSNFKVNTDNLDMICVSRARHEIDLVEVAGVEPASEVKIHKTSTHIVCFVLDLKL